MTHTIEANHTHRGALVSEQRRGKLLHTERTSSGESAWCAVWVDMRLRFVAPEAVAPICPVVELAELLKACNARVTLDMERNQSAPCWVCGCQREPFRELRKVGTYISAAGGNLRRGDGVRRPLCAECIAAVLGTG